MDLKLKTTVRFDGTFRGNLEFKSEKENLIVDFFFEKSYPKGSLKEGEEIKITFKIKNKEYPIVGTFPNVLKTLPNQCIAIFSLSYEEIYNLVFFFQSFEYGHEPKELSKEMSGQIDKQTINALFNI